MANSAGKGSDHQNSAKAGRSDMSFAEDAFKKATALHQDGKVLEASTLYKQIMERFPGSPRSELAKTLLAGIQKEKMGVLWNSAADARSFCKPDEAVRFYNLIIEEFPDSPEAASAKTEIANIGQIRQSWNAALNFQSKNNESKAEELFKRIVECFPDSPEGENARLLISIIHQNRVLPQKETLIKEEETSPEKIVAQLLLHKKAAQAAKGVPRPEAADQETLIKKIDKLWAQAVAIEQDGHPDEAAILYKKIIETSTNGHKVRDAKYRLEKIESWTGSTGAYNSPEQWGLKPAGPAIARQKRGSWKIVAGITAAIAIITAAALYFYHPAKPLTWTDIVENAKKSIVVVKTAAGAGSGFLISADGYIITSASAIAKEKDVEVRLYSGILKKAAVVKTGTVPLDIAVLKIDGADNQFLPMAGPDECREGEEIRAIGAPLGIEYFITKGIISHCNSDRDGVRYLQTDVPINPGNSGGPCIDKAGRVIGLSTGLKLGDDAQALNLVLPMTLIKDFMDGKLVALEEALLKKQEEKAQDVEQNKNKFYADSEKTYHRLQTTADQELTGYKVKLDNLLRTRAITYEQGKLMLEQVQYSPSGSGTLPQWVQSLSFKVVKGEISEESAVKLIKDHFKL